MWLTMLCVGAKIDLAEQESNKTLATAGALFDKIAPPTTNIDQSLNNYFLLLIAFHILLVVPTKLVIWSYVNPIHSSQYDNYQVFLRLWILFISSSIRTMAVFVLETDNPSRRIIRLDAQRIQFVYSSGRIIRLRARIYTQTNYQTH